MDRVGQGNDMVRARVMDLVKARVMDRWIGWARVMDWWARRMGGFGTRIMARVRGNSQDWLKG